MKPIFGFLSDFLAHLLRRTDWIYGGTDSAKMDEARGELPTTEAGTIWYAQELWSIFL